MKKTYYDEQTGQVICGNKFLRGHSVDWSKRQITVRDIGCTSTYKLGRESKNGYIMHHIKTVNKRGEVIA